MCIVVLCHGPTSRSTTNFVAAAQRMYRLDSKRSAVDLALRRLVGEPLGRDEALALQGSGFDFSNDEIESFSDTDRKLADES